MKRTSLRAPMAQFCILLMASAATVIMAERPEPEIVEEVGGDPVYQVLPAGQIPAINDPSYVSGDEAKAQMLDHEPVLGVVLGGKARAYSLWQLDAHEIVNDRMAGSAFAATW